MKRGYFIQMCLLSLVLFISCETDNLDDEYNENNKIITSDGLIKGTISNIRNDTYRIGVFARNNYDEILLLGHCYPTKEEFSIKLTTPPNTYLRPITVLEEPLVYISDPEAKFYQIWTDDFRIFNENKKLCGFLSRENGNGDGFYITKLGLARSLFMYIDRNCIIKGKNKERLQVWDVKLTKGWNVVYMLNYMDNDNIFTQECSTDEPEREILKWIHIYKKYEEDNRHWDLLP